MNRFVIFVVTFLFENFLGVEDYFYSVFVVSGYINMVEIFCADESTFERIAADPLDELVPHFTNHNDWNWGEVFNLY